MPKGNDADPVSYIAAIAYSRKTGRRSKAGVPFRHIDHHLLSCAASDLAAEAIIDQTSSHPEFASADTPAAVSPRTKLTIESCSDGFPSEFDHLRRQIIFSHNHAFAAAVMRHLEQERLPAIRADENATLRRLHHSVDKKLAVIYVIFGHPQDDSGYSQLFAICHDQIGDERLPSGYVLWRENRNASRLKIFRCAKRQIAKRRDRQWFGALDCKVKSRQASPSRNTGESRFQRP